jgi:hypothetical protein
VPPAATQTDQLRPGLLTPTRKLDLTYEDKSHRYTLNGERVPSVTTVIDGQTSKPGLQWWAFRVGLAAAVELARDGKLTWPELMAGHDDFDAICAGLPSEELGVPPQKPGGKWKTLIESKAVKAKLDPNNVAAAAARRGDGTHDALATLQLGDTPKVDELPERHRPFVRGLLKWWLDAEPDFEAVEFMVGHDELLYAGRFDMLYIAKNGDLVLGDIKTSREPRLDTWSRQLEAYKQAWLHMGGAPIDRTEIVLCRPTGEYSVHTTRCNPEAWTTLLASHYADVAFRKLQKEPLPEIREVDEDAPEVG